jgi:hypothetical protein
LEGYQGALKLYKSLGGGPKQDEGAALLGQAKGQISTLQGQADKAAAGLELMGAGTEAYMRRLASIQDFADSSYQSAAQNWDAAATKADEYVQAARARVGETLAQLDAIHAEINADRDFARAHAMQAGVQSVLGSMKDHERDILNQYGADSAEYEQFVQSKGVALATMQSNIYNSYQQLAEQADNTYLMATNEAMWKHNMYTGFQEQQHVETLKYLSEMEYKYSMQKASFDLALEQLRMDGMENMANWLIGTPDFNYDAMPLTIALSELRKQINTDMQRPERAYTYTNYGRGGWQARPGSGPNAMTNSQMNSTPKKYGGAPTQLPTLGSTRQGQTATLGSTRQGQTATGGSAPKATNIFKGLA